MLASHPSRLVARLIDGVIWATVMGPLTAVLLVFTLVDVGEIIEKVNPLREPGSIVQGYLESADDWESPAAALFTLICLIASAGFLQRQ